MAAVMPQTTPWMMPPRGSSDGVKERHATDERAPAAGERDIEQPPGFRGSRRWLRAFSRCYRRGGYGGRGRLADFDGRGWLIGFGGIGSRLSRHIWMLAW